MRRALVIAAVVVLAACGDTEPAGTPATAAAPPATIITTTTTTKPTTTTTPATTTESTTTPNSGSWSRTVIENPVSPGCCDMPVLAPASPQGEIPDEGWPADGFYALKATRLTEPPSTLELEISRWVPCAELPDQCNPDPPDDGVTADVATTVTRYLDLDDDATVVIWPLWPDELPAALVGTGADFAKLLLEGIDHAFVEWVLDPYEAGASVEQIGESLLAASTDPSFPFGTLSAGFLAYRGPLGCYLTANPQWMLDSAEPWPPGVNGLYNWWTTLEIRNGKPILYIDAGQIAG